MISRTLTPILHFLLWGFFTFRLTAQTLIDIGKFEEDLRISNYLYNAGLGRSVAAGDVNADGIDDMVIGAETIELFHLGGGGAFLIFGNKTLPRFIDLENPHKRVALWGGGRQDYAGNFIDIFDFSNDGVADIFISAPQWNFAGGNNREGRIYFLQGRAQWPEEITLQDYPGDSLSATLHGERSRAFLGSYSTHGDFNGDGIQDLAAVTRFADRPGPSWQQSTIYIIWGGQKLVTGRIDNPVLHRCTITPSNEKQFSLLIFSANLDGDGFDELIVTMPDADVLTELDFGGTGFILWGRKDWAEAIALEGWQMDDEVTRLIGKSQIPNTAALFASGDFDGNGIADMVINTFNDINHTSYARLYLNPFVTRPKIFEYYDPHHQLVVIIDPYAFQSFPYKMIKLDWNADGIDDLALSNVLGTRKVPELIYEGLVYVLYGSSSFPDTVDFRKTNATWNAIWGGSYDAFTGQSLAKGDLDADGKDDLIIGAWTATTKAGGASGETYVLLNRNREKLGPVPTRPSLLHAAPNPVRDNTVIWFDVSQGTNIQLEIFDILGRRVRLLKEGNLQPGRYSAIWNTRNEIGIFANSGVYFIVLRENEKFQMQKLLLLR